MDTLYILQDTITAHVEKVVGSCSHCVQETETNLADVEIVLYICLAVVASILIIAITVGIIVLHNSHKIKEFNELRSKKEKLEEDLKEKEGKNKELKADIDKLEKKCKDKKKHETACEVLERISSLARPKDGVTDDAVAKELYSLYNSIKNGIND